ncbi:MAG: LysR family transcriptional regulator [Alphaproteobacteria bacterium]|jgi:DNA-binding transcriptional LysR family regulator|nr:LysR family transcriptional regulator [Alphaproteobacteria bacterium]
MDKISGISAFARVVETGGFSAAARQLGVTPSAISKQVTQLENRLGARLLNRTTRQLSLTEVGTAFYERTKQILWALDEAEQAVSHLTNVPRGMLRVTVPLAFGETHIAPILPGFVTRYPDVSIEVVTSERVANLVEEGIDVAIRVGQGPDSSLFGRRLAPNRRIICASPAYLAARGSPQVPADLTGHNCLTYVQQGPRVEWRFGEHAEAFTVPVSGTIQSNSFSVLRAAAVAGVGITRLAGFIVGEELKSGALVELLGTYEANDGDIFVVYPTSRHLSPKVRAFIDYLVETIGQPRYWTMAGLSRSTEDD